MKMKSLCQKLGLLILSLSCYSCSTTSRLGKNSTLFQWDDNSVIGVNDSLSFRKVKTAAVTGTLIEKTDYLIFKPDSLADQVFENDLGKRPIQLIAGFRTEEAGRLYFPEIKFDSLGNTRKLHYTNVKAGLQALTIPFKFRGRITATDKIQAIAPQVETGLSLGFALGFKKNWNTYSPVKNFWGKNITTVSLTAGPMLGASAVDLKATINAPGLIGDRKSVALSYGGFLMFGVGQVNVGYAIGMDHVIGEGASKWVYGGKVWHGVIVALNVITF